MLELGCRLAVDADIPAISPPPLHAPLWPLCLVAWPLTRGRLAVSLNLAL